MKFELRRYTTVASHSVDTLGEYVPQNGENVFLEEIGGDASFEPYCVISITWDPGGAQEEVVFATHTSAVQTTHKTFVGNGVRKLRITLDNQSPKTQLVGGYVLGQRDGT